MEDFKDTADKLIKEKKWQELLDFANKSLAELNVDSENYNCELAQIYYAKAQALNFLESFEQVKVY